MYDRDQNGEFVHLYTATLGKVVVELIERRNGYGAPNAPIRLAAQRRLG